jgi:hypothetical protein
VNHLQLAAPLSVLVPALAIWLYAGWLSFANWQRSARGRAVGRLECLRFLLVTLLVFTLLRPEYVQHLQRNLTPEIAILMDASDSMKTRDLTLTNRIVSRAQWLDARRAAKFWLPLENKAKVAVEDFAVPSTNANAINGTDLNAALEQTLQRFKNLKAVLVLTDGAEIARTEKDHHFIEIIGPVEAVMKTEAGKSQVTGGGHAPVVLSVVEIGRIEGNLPGLSVRHVVDAHGLTEHPPQMEELCLEGETLVAPERPLRTETDVAVLVVGETLKGGPGNLRRGDERLA